MKVRGKVFQWAEKAGAVGRFLLKHVKVGEFETPSGEKYKGFKCSGKW